MKKRCDSEVLLKAGIVCLKGRITPLEEKRVVEELASLSVQDIPFITLYISSKGGSMKFALRLHDILKKSTKKVVGIVIDNAYSMAAIVLQGCSERKAYEDALFLIHDVRLAEDVTPNDELNERKEKGQEIIYKILSECSGRTVMEITEVCRQNKKMSAHEAKALGLIDEVI